MVLNDYFLFYYLKCLLKIVNDMLLISLFNKPDDFIHVKVEAIDSGSYEPYM